MDNFKFNILSRGQLASLNFKNITVLRGFFGNLIFAIIARMLCGNHLNNHLNPFPSFLSLLVVKWKTLSFSVYSSVDRTR